MEKFEIYILVGIFIILLIVNFFKFNKKQKKFESFTTGTKGTTGTTGTTIINSNDLNIPTGSYQNMCSNIHVIDDRLFATCIKGGHSTTSNDKIYSSINYKMCQKLGFDINSKDGVLKCDPVFNSNSCYIISGDPESKKIELECQTNRLNFKKSKINYNDCSNGSLFYNIDGNLICISEKIKDICSFTLDNNILKASCGTLQKSTSSIDLSNCKNKPIQRSTSNTLIC